MQNLPPENPQSDVLIYRTLTSPLMMVVGFLLFHDFILLLASSFDWLDHEKLDAWTVLFANTSRRLWLAIVGILLLLRVELFQFSGLLKGPSLWQKRGFLYLFFFAAFVVQEGFGHFFGNASEFDGSMVMFSLIGDMAIGLQEEIWFRGIVFLVLLRAWCQADFGGASRKNVLSAILASSAFFGMWHMQNALNGQDFWVSVMQVGYTFNLGIIFAVMLLVTGSLWVPIIAHGVFDIGVTITTLASLGANSSGAQATLSQAFQAYGSFVFLTSIIAFLSLRYLASLEPNIREQFKL